MGVGHVSHDASHFQTQTRARHQDKNSTPLWVPCTTVKENGPDTEAHAYFKQGILSNTCDTGPQRDFARRQGGSQKMGGGYRKHAHINSISKPTAAPGDHNTQ